MSDTIKVRRASFRTEEHRVSHAISQDDDDGDLAYLVETTLHRFPDSRNPGKYVYNFFDVTVPVRSGRHQVVIEGAPLSYLPDLIETLQAAHDELKAAGWKPWK